MSEGNRPRRMRVPSAPVDGPFVWEQLPYPVVHYPRRGVLLGFAGDADALPVLCACARRGWPGTARTWPRSRRSTPRGCRIAWQSGSGSALERRSR